MEFNPAMRSPACPRVSGERLIDCATLEEWKALKEAYRDGSEVEFRGEVVLVTEDVRGLQGLDFVGFWVRPAGTGGAMTQGQVDEILALEADVLAQHVLARRAVEILNTFPINGSIAIYPESDEPNQLRICTVMYAAAAQGVVKITRHPADGDEAEWWHAELAEDAEKQQTGGDEL